MYVWMQDIIMDLLISRKDIIRKIVCFKSHWVINLSYNNINNEFACRLVTKALTTSVIFSKIKLLMTMELFVNRSLYMFYCFEWLSYQRIDR